MKLRRLVAGLGILLLTFWGAGCGGTGAGAPPFSVVEAAIRAECLTATFVPEPGGTKVQHEAPPQDWHAIENAPKAMDAERGAVRVTLKPKPGATEVTITGIKFDAVDLGLRPIGSVFYRPCKRRLVGPVVESDLDGYIHKITASALHGSLGVGLLVPSDAKPIKFPWTVSLAKPLNLYLVVNAMDVWDTWAARISWTSGSSHGVIHVDNGGRKYRIVDGQGASWYKPGPGDQWVDSGSSRWIGIK